MRRRRCDPQRPNRTLGDSRYPNPAGRRETRRGVDGLWLSVLDGGRDLVFKGGKSLSKVFGIIDRFSEDIDLSLSPQFLNLPEAGTSRTSNTSRCEQSRRRQRTA
jgi:hypothetical protein